MNFRRVTTGIFRVNLTVYLSIIVTFTAVVLRAWHSEPETVEFVVPALRLPDTGHSQWGPGICCCLPLLVIPLQAAQKSHFEKQL
jgi:hypothetical protein